jgi:hypothetical protein
MDMIIFEYARSETKRLKPVVIHGAFQIRYAADIKPPPAAHYHAANLGGLGLQFGSLYRPILTQLRPSQKTMILSTLL